MNLTHPSIHLNGSSAETLLEAYTKAYEALVTAHGMLRATVPNARDYYVQGPNAHAQAYSEHQDRMARVNEVRAEIETLMEKVERDALERQRRR